LQNGSRLHPGTLPDLVALYTGLFHQTQNACTASPKPGPENYAGHRRKIVMLYHNNYPKAFSAVIPVSHYPGRPMSNPTAFITSFLARSALYRLVLVLLLLIAIWSAIFWSVSLP
tara:strand:- start:26 stop:370 length:345 start_codon:yes stop_codon:yes gene_type:complete